MISNKTILFADKCCNARFLAGQCLPINQSLLRFDLITTILKESRANDLTVKRLFATFEHSQTGLRYNFRQLINDDWIKLEIDGNDRRRKLVKPTKN